MGSKKTKNKKKNINNYLKIPEPSVLNEKEGRERREGKGREERNKKILVFEWGNGKQKTAVCDYYYVIWKGKKEDIIWEKQTECKTRNASHIICIICINKL